MTIRNAATGPLPLLLTFVLAVCGGGTAGQRPGYTITDSAGIRIIESRVPAWGEKGMRIDPEPFLRIGREAEGPYQFGTLGFGVLLADGSIAMSEVSSQELRIFDAAGNHVKTLGGPGEGPGEFKGLTCVFEYPGDSIAAFDGRLYRTTIFSLSSGGARTIRNQVAGNYGVFGLLQGGPFLLFNPGQFNRDLLPGLQWDSTNIVAMDPADGASRVIARLPSRQRNVTPDRQNETLIPEQGTIQAVAPDGFYWATSDRYEIRFYDGRGQLRRIQRRPVQPQLVDDSMIAEYESAMLAMVRRWEGEAAIARYKRSFAEGKFGKYVPLFGGAFVDHDRRLWVAESNWPAFQEPPRGWSVFSPEGGWLGDLEAPPGLRVVDCRGNTVLGIWKDENDVQYIQLHHLIADRGNR